MEARYNTPGSTLAFFVALCATTALLCVGLETRALVVSARYLDAAAVAVAWLVLVLLIRRYVFRTVSRSVRLLIAGRSYISRYQPCPNKAAQDVRDRAAALKIPIPFDVLIVPKSWNLVDAFVVPGIRGKHAICLTGGAVALASRSSATFQALIDHELAHIVNDDVRLLYTARALLYGATICLVPKAIALALGAVSGTIYSHLFPWRLTVREVEIFNYDAKGARVPVSPILIPISQAIPASTVSMVVVAFTILCLVTAIALYIAIVRNREFAADRFAIDNSPDKDRARRALGALLGSGEPHARVVRVWHPHPRLRTTMLTSQTRPQSTFGTDLLVLVSLVLARMTFGSSGLGAEFDLPPWLTKWIATPIYVLMFAFCISETLLDDGREALTWARVRNLSVVSLATALLALGCYLTLGRLVHSEETLKLLAGSERLLEIELLDFTLLFLALPTAVGVFGAMLKKASTTRQRDERRRAVVPAAVWTAGTLFVVGFVALFARERYCHKLSSEFVEGLDEQLDAIKKQHAHDADELPGLDSVTMRAGYNKALATHVFCSLTEPDFWPPLGWFLLSQGPYRADPWPSYLKNDFDKTKLALLSLFLTLGDCSADKVGPRSMFEPTGSPQR
jgi:Zn-dependent protease with chaperone function